MPTDTLQVTSHVARDLLQSAALFKHDHSVVWEYVSNGLEYVDPGNNPFVRVTIDSKGKKITISDNGRGMLISDLGRYFQMHGENIDRKKGKPGRGLFGTGKSAAFGIAEVLRVTTCKNGKRSQVELTRDDIETQGNAQNIPVKEIEREVHCSAANGTTVEIENIRLKKIDINSIIRHIERHIAHWPNATVIVNHHECSFAEPAISEEIRKSTKGTQFEETLGNVELIIKVAKAPLEEELQGIAILSGGNWFETTSAGCERKPFANYIFGEFEVPLLVTDSSPIPPFDMSRSMKLNPSNELVRQIYAFVGPQFEAARKELELKDRERKKEEEAKRLEQEADEIAEIINSDFREWRDQIRKASARAAGGIDNLPTSPDTVADEADLIFGDDEPATVVEQYGEQGHGKGNEQKGNVPPVAAPTVVQTHEPKDHQGKRVNKANSSKSRVGGFSVEFLEMGEDEARAKYVRDERTIFINLEHPQINAAKGSATEDDRVFRRLAYEVAFSEYAVALASEMAGGGHFLDVNDPIVEIRETLNRLARSAASLYAN